MGSESPAGGRGWRSDSLRRGPPLCLHSSQNGVAGISQAALVDQWVGTVVKDVALSLVAENLDTELRWCHDDGTPLGMDARAPVTPCPEIHA